MFFLDWFIYLHTLSDRKTIRKGCKSVEASEIHSDKA